MNKFRNKKVDFNGIKFDSKKELKRYHELKILENQGLITKLKNQPRFDIHVNGKYICFYKADFSYEDDKKNFIVEDVKSKATKTPVYNLKKKLIQSLYDFKITEIY